MNITQDFRPARRCMELPTVETFQTQLPSMAPIPAEFEDAAAAHIFRAPFEITTVMDSSLPYLSESASSDDALDSLRQFEVVKIFGGKYFVRPCYLDVMDFLENIETESSYIITTAQPGTGISTCGYVIFAKMLINEMKILPEGPAKRFFVFVDKDARCWSFCWVR